MTMILSFLIGFAGGWSLMACDALFRAEDRPGIFQGTLGMVLLLVFTMVGGLTLAGGMVWAFQTVITSGIVVILAAGMVLGWAASKRLHVNTTGAANRMFVGLAALALLYGAVWTLYPAPPPPPELTQTAPTSK